MILLMGEVYREKSIGPRTEPWGTTKRRGRGVEEKLLILTNFLRLKR